MPHNNNGGETLHVFIDGASLGNPGPSGIGVIITNRRRLVLKQLSRYIGIKTNNQAEYIALITALETLKGMKIKPEKVIVYTDSELLYNQVAGRFKVKNPILRGLHDKVRHLLNGQKVELRKVPRGIDPEMKAVDRLAKRGAKGGKKQ